MKKYILLALFLVCTISKIHSQGDLGFYYTWGVIEGDKRYIFANVANIRNGAGSSTEVIDKLTCGHEITILKDTEVEEAIDGLTGRWINVSYQKDGADKEGYLWQGTLSYTQMRRGDVKFVFGLYKDTGHVVEAQVKAVQGTEILSAATYTVSSTSTAGGRIIDKTGLKGVDFVVEIMFGGAACGVGTYYDYFAWTGEKLLHMTQISSVGDGGIYAYVEELQFPAQGVNSDLLVKLMQEGAAEDEIKDTDWLYKTEIYRWTGTKLVKVDQNWKTGERW